MENRHVNFYIRRLFSQSAIYGIGDIGGKLLNLLLIPLHTYYLTIHEYSIFTLFLLFYSFGIIFYLLGINSGFVRYFLDEKYKRTDVFSTAFLFILFLNFILSLLIFIFSYINKRSITGGEEYLSLFSEMPC